MGTVLWERKSRRVDSSMRSSSHPEMLRRSICFTSGLRHHDGGRAAGLRHQVDLVRRERAGRGSADVAPAEVVLAAVTVAEDASAVFLIGDDAVEPGAGGRDSPELAFAGADA